MRFASALTTLIVSRSAAFQHSYKPPRRAMTRAFAASDSSRETLLNCPTIALSDGTSHPAIGFGTYKVGFIPASASSAVTGTEAKEDERTARECVADALDCGYRFLECAEFYGNESEVGKAIAESGIKREDLFLCSKVWTTTIEKGPEAVRAQLEKTLTDLGTDYLDLYCKICDLCIVAFNIKSLPLTFRHSDPLARTWKTC
jgi:hypothetical protein